MNDDNNSTNTPPAWNATDHIRAAAAEVLAAERIHSAADIPADVCWLGGHNPGIDITAVINGEDIHADAKAAFFQTGRPGDICWMGRELNYIPEATTHIALVILADRTDVRVTTNTADSADLNIQGLIAGDVYLVPRALALTATAALKQDRTVGKGRNVGLPLSEVQQFLLPQGPPAGQAAV